MAKTHEEEIVDKVYARFKEVQDHPHRKGYEKDRDEAKRAFKGRPFSDDQEKQMEKDKMPVVKVARGATNALRFASILTASKPELKALAVGSGDSGVATLMQRAYTKIWQQNNASSKAQRCVLETVQSGLSHLTVLLERTGKSFDVNIQIKRLKGDKVFYDPETDEDDFGDYGYRIVARPITREDAKKRHGLKDDELYYALVEPPKDKEGSTHDSKPGGSYTDAEEGYATKKERDIWEIEFWQPDRYKAKWWLDNGTGTLIPRLDDSRDDEIARMRHTLNTKYGKDGTLSLAWLMPTEQRFTEVETDEKDLRYCLVVGKKLVEEMTNPYGKDNLNQPIDPTIPLGNIAIDESYPRGNMFFAIGPLQEISKRRAQSISIVAHTMGSPIVYKEGTINVEQWKKDVAKPREMLGYRGDSAEDKPGPLYPVLPDLSRVFALEDRATRDLDDCFNLTPVMKGEQDTGRMSGRLAAMLKEFGLEGNTYILTNLEEMFRKLGVVICKMCLDEWPAHYWQRLMEKEDFDPATGQPLPKIAEGLQKILAKDVSIIDYDFSVRSGSSLPANRMARLDMALELAQVQIAPDAPVDAEWILSYIDDPQVEAMLSRRDRFRELMGQTQQMGAQMEQLAQQLEAVMKELKSAHETIADLRLDHEVDKTNIKGRYEITIQKLNLVIEALRRQANANSPARAPGGG